MPRALRVFAALSTALLPSLSQAEISPMSAHFLARFDANGDQQVSLQELAEARTADFLKYDMDGDRMLSADEFARLSLAHAAHEASPEVLALGTKPHRILGALTLEESDLDQDGQVSKAEYQGNSALWFKEVDANQDGIMTPNELDAW